LSRHYRCNLGTFEESLRTEDAAQKGTRKRTEKKRQKTAGEGSGNGRIQLNEQIRNPFTAARREALMLTSLALSDFRNRVKPA